MEQSVGADDLGTGHEVAKNHLLGFESKEGRRIQKTGVVGTQKAIRGTISKNMIEKTSVKIGRDYSSETKEAQRSISNTNTMPFHCNFSWDRDVEEMSSSTTND